MNRIEDKIVFNSLWVFRPKSFNLSAADIIAKVIRVSENRVFLIRKTDFGFTDLPPTVLTKKTFINNYLYLDKMS